ncbi:MAG: hypothetical protein ACKO45_08315 [Cyanobium sp.]
MTLCPELWLTTAQMAGRLGVHPKTLLRLRAASFSPFCEGVHFRRGGLTTKAPFQWHGERCEEAFTAFGRVDPASVEAFSREPLLVACGEVRA